jgi:hypothetical protein
MKKGSTLFLQGVIILIGIVVLGLMLWEPQLEGVNAGKAMFEIYFNDPFLAYVYASSIAFFVALYEAFKVLGYIRQNKTFSQPTVDALKMIKYCGTTLAVLMIGLEAYIMIVQRTKSDDIAGGVAMGLMLIFVSAVIATAAGVFEKLLQSAVDLKSENELTV